MIVSPFILEVTFSGTYGSRPWANIQHLFWNASGGDRNAGNLGNIATDMDAAWSTALADAMNENVHLESIKVQDLDSETGLTSLLATSAVGARSSTGMPANVAVLATKDDNHGRNLRPGRAYFIGVCEVDTAAGNPNALDSTGVTTWQTAVNDYFALLSGTSGGETYFPVVLHKGTTPDSPIPYNMSSMSVSSLLATQRRRLRG